jgi:hypothetical protein
VTRRDAGWLAVAAAALAAGAALAAWAHTPSLGVRAQLQLDRALEALARWAGDRDGVFPLPEQLAAAAGPVLPQADPWGRPWRYERVAARGPIRLWSTGADGQDQRGAGDDIAAWTR